MAKQQIKTVNLKGEKEAIKFDKYATVWYVANWSESDIYVSLDAEADISQSNRVAPGEWFKPTVNMYAGADNNATNTIYITGTGSVEVQQLCWK